jgi:hypothetical protein
MTVFPFAIHGSRALHNDASLEPDSRERCIEHSFPNNNLIVSRLQPAANPIWSCRRLIQS